MILRFESGRPLCGEVWLPGDKSISHRAALFAALADGQSRCEHFLSSGVTEVLLNALTELGVAWAMEEDCLVVEGGGWRAWRTPSAPLYCGNSATTLRLLAGALAAGGVEALLDGSDSLRRRPMERIILPLRTMGVNIQAAPGGFAPLQMAARPAGRKLAAGEHVLSVASAQVKTCLVLAALAADGQTTIREPSLSRDHSERMLRSMGVAIEQSATSQGAELRITLPLGALTPLHVTIPGDFSAAAFLIVAATLAPGSDVLIRGVGLNPTRTGLLQALREMGTDLEVSNLRETSGEPVGDLRVRAARLTGGQVSGAQVVDMIDEFPVFAIAAAGAHGTTVVRDALELRAKESDRITELVIRLRALGVEVEENLDGFVIHGQGCIPGGVRLPPSGDHRLAMAMGVAGLAAQAYIEVEQAEIMRESFPAFAEVVRSLGGSVVEAGG
jgi:3-phosphoshikimate 1-carboxyvinyltransferase